jgi:hypothetical protein
MGHTRAMTRHGPGGPSIRSTRGGRYYAHRMTDGVVLANQWPDVVPVFGTWHLCTPIGVAHAFGWNCRGEAFWRLEIGGREIEGVYIAFDGEYWLAQ